MQNSDPFDSVLCEDSNMFDNTNNYSLLDTKIKAWLPKISNTEIDEFAKTSMLGDNGDFHLHINTENPPFLSGTPKVEKIHKTNVNTKSRHLSIFESEEPVIKEDLESSCCTNNKLAFELRDEMEVAEEVVVTTEYCDELKYTPSSFFLNADSPEFPVVLKEEDITKKLEEISSPLGDLSKMETPYDIKMQFDGDENFFCSLSMVNSPSPVHVKKATPALHLDIAAAMDMSDQLLLGPLPDTPDVLKTVLSPGLGFSLVKYVDDNVSNMDWFY